MRLVALVLDLHDEVRSLLDLPLKSIFLGAYLLDGGSHLSFLGLVVLGELMDLQFM